LFIEILPVVRVVSVVKKGWRVVVPFNPLLIGRRKHTIIRILLNYHFNRGLSIGRISCPHASLLLKDTSQPFASQRRLAIKRCHWRSQLRINDNVFGVGHFKLSNYKLEYSNQFTRSLFVYILF